MNMSGSQQTNPQAVLHLLIKSIDAKVTRETSNQCVINHPEYPSLLAISDCLTDWGIENEAYRMDKGEFNAAGMRFPFIAHFPEKDGYFVLVHQLINQTVLFSDEDNYKGTMDEKIFLDRWSGITLTAETTIKSGEKNYQQKRLSSFIKDLLFPASLVVLLGIIYLVFFQKSFNLFHFLLGLVKLTGVGGSILLLVQSINSNNPFIQNLCKLGGKDGCNAILKTDAANLTSWLSWSEVGFFYFGGSLLLLLLSPQAIGILAWLNLFAMPYTIYSLSYQYRKQNWCILCCLVQAVLWLEFFILIFLSGGGISTVYNLSNISSSLFYLLPLAFLFPIVVWGFLKPFFSNAAQLIPLQEQLKKFKYNIELFNQVLTSQPRYAVTDELMPVLLGNPEADNVITIVSNPYCEPCAKAHQVMEDWIERRNDVQLKVVFSTVNEDNDMRTKIARHMTALQLLDNKAIVKDALNEWYAENNRNYDNWALKYPVSFNSEMREVSKKQRDWCNMVGITFTPTIFVNGYRLPEPYTLEDVKYLIN